MFEVAVVAIIAVVAIVAIVFGRNITAGIGPKKFEIRSSPPNKDKEKN
jgi:hypothetical protein